jgi:ribokinase
VAAVPREGETVLGFDFDEPLDGGKATNQAVAAARLGAPVVLVCAVGNDERGRRAVAYLAEEGVDTSWVFEVEGPTDVGFVMLPPSAVPAIAVAMDRNRALDADAVTRAAPAIEGASVVVCQLEAPVEAALAAFAIARRRGITTILNPAPPVDGLDPELLGLADVLVPNEHEAAVLVGRDGEPAALAAELAGRLSCEAVIVTAGEAGAYVAAGGEVTHLAAPACVPADTTGAGDAFVGALAVRLRAADGLVDAAAYAVRAATLSVTRPGTMPAYPTAGELA